jgi:hypothetical protein
MPSPLRPRELFATLNDHRVRYVIIGGLGAVLHGSAIATVDADVCPDSAPDNLERLCRALVDMNARIRTATDPDGVPFRCEAGLLVHMKMLNLVTDFGDFDLSFQPAASEGYDDLVRRSVETTIPPSVVVKVAALQDIITSKETADRAKDRAVLPQLYALRDEIALRDRGGADTEP